MIDSLLWQLGLLLFVTFVIIMFIGSIILFIRAKKNSKLMEKTDLYGYTVALFFLFIAFGYIVRVYFMFFIAQNEQEFLMQMRAIHRLPDFMPLYTYRQVLLLQFLWQLHMAFVLIGIGFLMFSTEFKIYKKTKYFFTILAFVMTVLTLSLPYPIAHQFFYVSYLCPIAWLIIYGGVAKNSTGSVRRNAIMLIVGFLFFIIGIILNSGTARYITTWFGGTAVGELFTVLVAPIMLMIGFIIILLALLNKF